MAKPWKFHLIKITILCVCLVYIFQMKVLSDIEMAKTIKIWIKDPVYRHLSWLASMYHQNQSPISTETLTRVQNTLITVLPINPTMPSTTSSLNTLVQTKWFSFQTHGELTETLLLKQHSDLPPESAGPTTTSSLETNAHVALNSTPAPHQLATIIQSTSHHSNKEAVKSTVSLSTSMLGTITQITLKSTTLDKLTGTLPSMTHHSNVQAEKPTIRTVSLSTSMLGTITHVTVKSTITIEKLAKTLQSLTNHSTKQAEQLKITPVSLLTTSSNTLAQSTFQSSPNSENPTFQSTFSHPNKQVNIVLNSLSSSSVIISHTTLSTNRPISQAYKVLTFLSTQNYMNQTKTISLLLNQISEKHATMALLPIFYRDKIVQKKFETTVSVTFPPTPTITTRFADNYTKKLLSSPTPSKDTHSKIAFSQITSFVKPAETTFLSSIPPTDIHTNITLSPMSSSKKTPAAKFLSLSQTTEIHPKVKFSPMSNSKIPFEAILQSSAHTKGMWGNITNSLTLTPKNTFVTKLLSLTSTKMINVSMSVLPTSTLEKSVETWSLLSTSTNQQEIRLSSISIIEMEANVSSKSDAKNHGNRTLVSTTTTLDQHNVSSSVSSTMTHMGMNSTSLILSGKTNNSVTSSTEYHTNVMTLSSPETDENLIISRLLSQISLLGGILQSKFLETKTPMTSTNTVMTTTSAPITKNPITNPGVSIVYCGDNGRLGNQMSSLASLLALEWEYGVRAFVSSFQLQILAPYYQSELFNRSIRNIELVFPDWKQISWRYSYPDINNLNKSHWPPEKNGQFYFIGVYVVDVQLFLKHIVRLRQVFVMKQKYSEEAERRLMILKNTHTSESSNVRPTFISVHNRRSDYGYHLKVTHNLTYVDDAYFFRAIDHCRRKYQNAMFYIVTDDPSWAKLLFHNNTSDVFFLGVKDNKYPNGQPISPIDDVGIDMALLKLANHSILTYGTFGMWGALLAGGDVIMPRSHENETLVHLLNGTHLGAFDLL